MNKQLILFFSLVLLASIVTIKSFVSSDPFFAEDGYEGMWVSQTNPDNGKEYFEVKPCEVVEIDARFKNTGTLTWYRDGEDQVAFNIYKDKNVTSFPKGFSYKPGVHDSYFEHSSWLRPYRINTINERSVKPGQVGSITMKFQVPCDAVPGTYREDISVAVGKRWMAAPPETADAEGVAHIWVGFVIPGVSVTNPSVELKPELRLALLEAFEDRKSTDRRKLYVNDHRDEGDWGLLGIIASAYRYWPDDDDIGTLDGNRLTLLYVRTSYGGYDIAFEDERALLSLLDEVPITELSTVSRKSLFPTFATTFNQELPPNLRTAAFTLTEPWKLPFRAGTSIKVTQGYNGQGVYPCTSSGNCSHYDTKALDFVGKEDKTIVAPRSGVINTIGYDRRWNGNYIIIDHLDGLFSMYLHLKTGTIVVEKGEEIGQGEPIATMGNTGFSTGPHLDFRVCRRNYKCNQGATVTTTFVEADNDVPQYTDGKFDYVSDNSPAVDGVRL